MTDKPDKPDKPDDPDKPADPHAGDDRWDDPLHRATGLHTAVVPPEDDAEQRGAEQRSEAKPAAEHAVGERSETELAAERLAAERLAAERLASERAEAQRVEDERLAAERAAVDLVIAQRAEEEKATALRAELQAAQDKRAADQRAADERAAAERSAADAKRAKEQWATDQKAEAEAAEAKRVEAQRAADARAAQQRAVEQHAAEQRAAEQRAADEAAGAAEPPDATSKRPAAPPPRGGGGGGLALGEAAAGAGALGLIGAAAIFVVAIVFFVAESFFLATLLISFALLVYVAGAELGKLLWSSLTVFFSSKHLIKNATYISETVVALRKALHMRRDDAGNIKVGPIEAGTKIKLPDNPLVRELQAVLKRKKGKEYSEYIAHQYYVDCRELYDHFHAHLEFVANVMPLFGLIGTVIGLIGMFDRLGSNTSIENLSPQLAISLQCTLWGAIFASLYMTIASRFDQRIRALEYDFDILLHSFDVLVENGADVELQA